MVMDMGVLYAVADFTGVLLIIALLVNSLSSANKVKTDRHVVILFGFFMAYCFVDGMWGLFWSNKVLVYPKLFRLASYGFHTVSAISAFAWFGYMLHYLNVEENDRAVMQILRGILLVAQVTVLVMNYRSNQLFVVDENNVYSTGPLRSLSFGIQFSYYAILALYAIFRRVTDRTTNARVYRNGLILSLIPITFGVSQLYFPDAPMYSLGFMLSTACIFAFTVTEDRERYMEELARAQEQKHTGIIKSLAEDYICIYYVDTESDSYENFVIDAENEALVAVENGESFTARALRDIEECACSEDRGILADLMGREKLLRSVEAEQKLSRTYRMLLDGVPTYVELKINHNKKDGKMIVGIHNINASIEREAEASRAKSTFLFNMSHDIRTPMNAILGFTRIAQNHIDERDRVEDSLNKISRSGQQLLALINEVLEMSRIESGKIEIEETGNNLEHALDDINPMLSHALQRGSGQEHRLCHRGGGHIGQICLDGHPPYRSCAGKSHLQRHQVHTGRRQGEGNRAPDISRRRGWLRHLQLFRCRYGRRHERGVSEAHV